jgi:hypothetical protein
MLKFSLLSTFEQLHVTFLLQTSPRHSVRIRQSCPCVPRTTCLQDGDLFVVRLDVLHALVAHHLERNLLLRLPMDTELDLRTAR